MEADLPTTSARAEVVTARSASAADLERVSALHVEACDSIGASRGGAALVSALSRGPDAAGTVQSFLDALANGAEVVLVGCIGDLVVGYAVMLAAEHQRTGTGQDPRMPHSAVIEELFVRPAARRIGVGSALLESLRAESARRGYDSLEATALPGDRDTKNFFEDHSMVARAIVVGGPTRT